MKSCLFYMMLLLLPSGHLLAEDTIIRRGNLQPLQGEILHGGTTGLRLDRTEFNEGTILIPWSSIKAIDSEKPHSGLATFVKQGDQLYRAKQRLLRGDVQLAEPVFATLFKKLVGTDSVDARIAAEGYLRCAVAHGNLALALHPWLETIRLDELAFETPFPSLQPILDPSTLLCPHLPPVWTEIPSAMKTCASYAHSTLEKTSSIASVLIASNTTSQLLPVQDVEDPVFLSMILGAANGHPTLRRLLIEQLDGLPPWKKTWAHYFLAQGYLSDQTEDARVQGMLHLARVSSDTHTDQPWLRAASMLLLSNELEQEGADRESQRILYEAHRLFPSHPLVLLDKHTRRNFSK